MSRRAARLRAANWALATLSARRSRGTIGAGEARSAR
jgi:hypothetical protein